MRIKENSEKVKVKSFPIIFFIAALTAIVLRSYQVGFLIDSSTGFFNSSSVVTVILYVLLLLSGLLFFLMSYLSKDSANYQVATIKSNGLFVVTFFFGFSLVYDWIFSFADSVFSLGNTNISSDVGNFKSMMISGTIPLFFQSIFALLSAIYIFILAASFKTGSGKASKHKILALSLVGWVAFRLIRNFVRQISFIRVSDLLFELIMLGLMILFFDALAQVTSNVYSDGCRWRLTGFGLPSALLALTISVPRLIFTFINREQFINAEYPFNIADLIFAIFAITLAISLIKQKKPISVSDLTEKGEKDVAASSDEPEN